MTTESSNHQTPAQAWDALAPWWKQAFTDGADVEYEGQILPIIQAELNGATSVLDLGCGEGQVGRLLTKTPGVHVVGVDPSMAQLHNATAWSKATSGRARKSAVGFVRGAGEHLPFATGAFDAVVCCLAIEHADDVDAVLAESARVVRHGGRFVLLVNHPMYQGTGSGFIDDQILNEQYWRVGPYLEETVSVEEVDKGVFISFSHRPMSRYINPLCERGLVLTKLLEPPPVPEFLEQSIAPQLERSIPRLLVMRFERLGT